jgi:hypothetical protein
MHPQLASRNPAVLSSVVIIEEMAMMAFVVRIAVKQTTRGGIFIDSTSLSIALERGSTAPVRPFANRSTSAMTLASAATNSDKHDHALTFVNIKYEHLLTMSASAYPHPGPGRLRWGM